jgi:hypothetical protein
MHLNQTRRPVRHVEPQWLPLAGQITRLVNGWSRRRDLSVYVGQEVRSDAAASYRYTDAEIDVDAARCFGLVTLPERIGDFTLRETHFDFPEAAGAILHEAMHAQYSIPEWFAGQALLTRQDEQQFYFSLEEPRIEGFGVHQYPDNKEFLRACALGIVLKDSAEAITTMTHTQSAATLALYSMARVDAGVLKKKDIKEVRKAVRKIIPTPVLKELRELWRENLTLKGKDAVPRQVEIAVEFARIVREQEAKARAERAANGESEEDFNEELMKFLEELMKALGADALRALFDAKDEIHHTRKVEANERAQKERREEAADATRNKQMARETFDMSGEHTKTGTSASEIVKTRKPTDQERAVANKLAKAFEKAKYRDRIVTRHAVSIPPGRLHAGTAMQGAAIKRNGGSATTDPWRIKKRHVVEDPSLRLGIMCDISGSMSLAMEPIAVSTWVMSAAAKRVKARAAAVYFGSDAFPVLAPGQSLEEVTVWSASDGTENFDKGFRLLDGALELLDGHGARMLVVCSDGQYGGAGQFDACLKWLKRCRAAGVAVLWLDYKNSHVVSNLCEQTGAHHVIVGKDVIAAATAIGAAATDALSKASAY